MRPGLRYERDVCFPCENKLISEICWKLRKHAVSKHVIPVELAKQYLKDLTNCIQVSQGNKRMRPSRETCISQLKAIIENSRPESAANLADESSMTFFNPGKGSNNAGAEQDCMITSSQETYYEPPKSTRKNVSETITSTNPMETSCKVGLPEKLNRNHCWKKSETDQIIQEPNHSGNKPKMSQDNTLNVFETQWMVLEEFEPNTPSTNINRTEISSSKQSLVYKCSDQVLDVNSDKIPLSVPLDGQSEQMPASNFQFVVLKNRIDSNISCAQEETHQLPPINVSDDLFDSESPAIATQMSIIPMETVYAQIPQNSPLEMFSSQYKEAIPQPRTDFMASHKNLLHINISGASSGYLNSPNSCIERPTGEDVVKVLPPQSKVDLRTTDAQIAQSSLATVENFERRLPFVLAKNQAVPITEAIDAFKLHMMRIIVNFSKLNIDQQNILIHRVERKDKKHHAKYNELVEKPRKSLFELPGNISGVDNIDLEDMKIASPDLFTSQEILETFPALKFETIPAILPGKAISKSKSSHQRLKGRPPKSLTCARKRGKPDSIKAENGNPSKRSKENPQTALPISRSKSRPRNQRVVNSKRAFSVSDPGYQSGEGSTQKGESAGTPVPVPKTRSKMAAPKSTDFEQQIVNQSMLDVAKCTESAKIREQLTSALRSKSQTKNYWITPHPGILVKSTAKGHPSYPPLDITQKSLNETGGSCRERREEVAFNWVQEELLSLNDVSQNNKSHKGSRKFPFENCDS